MHIAGDAVPSLPWSFNFATDSYDTVVKTVRRRALLLEQKQATILSQIAKILSESLLKIYLAQKEHGTLLL